MGALKSLGLSSFQVRRQSSLRSAKHFGDYGGLNKEREGYFESVVLEGMKPWDQLLLKLVSVTMTFLPLIRIQI